MSSFQQRWAEAQQGMVGGGEEWAAFKQAWPHLWEALFGVPNTKEAEGRPPCKLLLFPEADKLKFMLSPQWGNLVAFGTFPDALGGFDGLNDELGGGRFEWKKRKR